MKISTLLLAPALMLAAGPALAQTAQAGQPLGGKAISGICLLSQQAVLSNSKIGLAATARLKQVTDAADAEIAAARAPVEAENRTFQAEAPNLKPADLQARQKALAGRVQTLQQLADQRRRELEATRQRVIAQISQDAQPVIAQVYKTRGCGLLFDRNSVLGGNMSGDLTADVVKGLDAKVATITFDRASLPPQAAAPRQ